MRPICLMIPWFRTLCEIFLLYLWSIEDEIVTTFLTLLWKPERLFSMSQRYESHSQQVGKERIILRKSLKKPKKDLDISNGIATFVVLKVLWHMRTSEFKKLLKDAGCYFVKHGGRHDKWFSPITGNSFFVPRHDSQEIPNGTLAEIRKQAGI